MRLFLGGWRSRARNAHTWQQVQTQNLVGRMERGTVYETLAGERFGV